MKSKKLLFKITGAVSAIVISFGVVFGLALTGKTSLYIDFDHPKQTISYANTPTTTKWNGSGTPDPFSIAGPGENAVDQQTSPQNKYNYSALCVDGANHQVLDQSFNQSGYQGLVDWTWTNGWYDSDRKPVSPLESPSSTWNNTRGSAYGTQPTTDNTSDFWKTYATLIESGRKSLILPGYLHQSGLDTFYKQDKNLYKTAGYILLDANIPENEDHVALSEAYKNVASIVFRADEAAFMSGIATCQYLNDNFDEYHKDGSLSVGTFGGLNIPTVTIYMGGFEQGIIAWNNNVEAIAKKEGWNNPDQHKVNFINLGKMDSYFSNSFSIGDGKPMAAALLQRGADAILPVAGTQSIDAVKEIQSYKSNCIVVGIDTMQELDMNVNGKSIYTDTKGNSDVIKFSATKNISSITSQILSLSYAGLPNDSTLNDSGETKVGSYGYLTVADIRNNGVSSSEPSLPYLEKFILSVFPGVIPPGPEEDLSQWVIDQLSNLQIPGALEPTNYFTWLSLPENMVFRI